MDFIMNNWFMIIAVISIVVVGGLAIYKFANQPSSEQLKKVKEWLLYAVTLAEKELGGGTGALKLRLVYDQFVLKFPWLAKVVSFETFSKLVDESLDEMNHLLTTNDKIQDFVGGSTHE